MLKEMLDFYKDKRIFVTGCTGFKGSWLCTILCMAGADVTGYALLPDELSLCRIIDLEAQIELIYGDVRDLAHMEAAFDRARPEIVFHLAAQPIVREGYKNPVGTYSTNVMGTVHVLECVRQFGGVKSFLNVTTDKVYENRQWLWGYREADCLNGFDPYANSKSCSELVTDSYRKSFFADNSTAISTARAGNVIGGGDFSSDRIIPDCVRAARKGELIQLRNPKSIRPYQHVLDPLMAYLLIAQRQYEDATLAGSYNVGPDDVDCITTGELADLFCLAWGNGARWKCEQEVMGFHEDAVLKLDSAKIRSILGWSPKWHVEQAVAEVVDWSKAWLDSQDMRTYMEQQIQTFINGNGL